MCQFVRFRRLGTDYICISIDRDGLEHEITRGPKDYMVAFIQKQGLGCASYALLEENLEKWCEDL